MTKQERKIISAWQGLKNLTDEQMKCDHDYWQDEYQKHWTGICRICGIDEDDDLDHDNFAHFHDGFLAGKISRLP